MVNIEVPGSDQLITEDLARAFLFSSFPHPERPSLPALVY